MDETGDEVTELHGYRVPPFSLFGRCVLYAVSAGLGSIGAATVLDGCVAGWALLAVAPLPFGIVWAASRPAWLVRVSPEGLWIARTRGVAEMIVWRDIGEYEKEWWSPVCETCYRLEAEGLRLWLPLTDDSRALGTTIGSVSEWPGQRKAQIVPRTAISLVSWARPAAAGRALSPADPPDQLTESEDA